MTKKHELDSLADQYKRYGISTLIFLIPFATLIAIVIRPGLQSFDFKEFASPSPPAPPFAIFAAYAGAIAAFVAIITVVLIPIFIFLLAKWLKTRTHYKLCKLAVKYLSYARPTQTKLVKKTLTLLEDKEIQKLFH